MTAVENSLAQTLRDNLATSNGKLARAGKVAGNHLNQAESNLVRAFSLSSSDGSNSKTARLNLAKQLGMKANAENVPTAEALQVIAKTAYERASRAYSLVSQLLSNSHQTLMHIIQQLRVR